MDGSRASQKGRHTNHRPSPPGLLIFFSLSSSHHHFWTARSFGRAFAISITILARNLTVCIIYITIWIRRILGLDRIRKKEKALRHQASTVPTYFLCLRVLGHWYMG